MMTWLRRLGGALRSAVDAKDLHFYGGLGLATAGGCQVSVPWTMVAVGSLLAVVGFLSSRGV